jgi:alpha-tubulin suppressor-like RCC1 family protein
VAGSVDAGIVHACGLNTDGTLACWGDNSRGQATPPAGPFAAVSAGGIHTCGMKTDGTVACWGSNSGGQATPPAGFG